MNEMEIQQSLTEAQATHSAIFAAWPEIQKIFLTRINYLTSQLVNENNEETRGRIKELRHWFDFERQLFHNIHEMKEAMKASANVDKELFEE